MSLDLQQDKCDWLKIPESLPIQLRPLLFRWVELVADGDERVTTILRQAANAGMSLEEALKSKRLRKALLRTC